MTSPKPNYPPKSPSVHIIMLGVRASTYKFGEGGHISTPSTFSPLSLFSDSAEWYIQFSFTFFSLVVGLIPLDALTSFKNNASQNKCHFPADSISCEACMESDSNRRGEATHQLFAPTFPITAQNRFCSPLKAPIHHKDINSLVPMYRLFRKRNAY